MTDKDGNISKTTTEGFAWERKPDETDEAWAAFHRYLTMDHPRNKSRLADELGKHSNQIYRWGSLHNWNERVRLYDSYKVAADTVSQVQLTAEVRAELEKEAVKDEVEDYRRLRDLFTLMVDRTEARLINIDNNDDEARDVSIRDISSLITMRKNLDDLIRRAGGLPLSYKEVERESEVDEYIISLEGNPIPVKESNKGAVQEALTWGRDDA